jgi:hypothetical protein
MATTHHEPTIWVASDQGASPALQSTDERLAETAAILAAGLVRLAARKSSRKVAQAGESSLDFLPARSVAATVSTGGGLR